MQNVKLIRSKEIIACSNKMSISGTTQMQNFGSKF